MFVAASSIPAERVSVDLNGEVRMWCRSIVTRWLATACLLPVAGQAQAIAYDAYIAGIRVATIERSARSPGASWTVRKREWESNGWSSTHRATPVVSTDSAFLLWGALRDVVGRIPSIERIDWWNHEVVAWPDRATLYERSASLAQSSPPARSTKGRRLRRFNRRAASSPMDLVVDSTNAFVAAIDPRADVVLVRRGDEWATTVAAWNGPGVSPARFGYRRSKEMVPMPDGVRLASIVLLPSGDGARAPFPTILVRTPYGISRSVATFWHYAARGYAVVLQAVRGTSYTDPEYRSEGELEIMVNEPADGKATLDWIVKQSWSDGQVCMQGGSYLGYTQWTAAMSAHPALKCLVPEVSMGTAFADQPYVGGGLLVGMAYYQFMMHDRPLLPGRTWTEVLAHRPLVDLDEFGTGRSLPNWDKQVMAATNGDYWRGQNWHAASIRPELATFQISGWFDDDLPGR